MAAWRRPGHTDDSLVRLVSFGAFLAVDRLESVFGRTFGRSPAPTFPAT